jgi:glycosyltransferase involved in cell wall biosynthesis
VSDLLVTTHTPALDSGRSVRTYGIARALAELDGLDVLYVRFGAAGPDARFAAIAGAHFHEVVPSRGARRALAWAAARRAGVPAGFARGVSAELAQHAAELAGEPGRGRVIADGPTAAAALAGLSRSSPVIYNAHNVEFTFRGELASVGRREARALRSFERDLLERASEAWMVSDADMASARELSPGARLRLVPNVIDVAAIEPITEPAPEQRAVFVGSFDYEPNRNALAFLLEEILPRVWSELPSARLAVVGGGLRNPPETDERVELLGFVEDLGATYRGARCAVVPLLQGGGTPLKLIEAMAYGLPVVATERAVAGMDVRDGEHCHVARDGESFARALVGVLRGGDHELGLRARKLVGERYSIEALVELLRD